MEVLKWQAEMALGVAELDQAHQALLEQMAHLLTASDAQFDEGLPQLVAHLETDFRAEEELMERIGYPALQCHLEQHARVLATLHGIDHGDRAGARRAVELLPMWFQVHLSTQDAALAMALNLADA